MRDRLDYLFLLPTFDRYDYLVQVIDRIIEQTKTFSVKIGIVNDHSKDQRYDGLLKKYGDILVYEKNEVNYGKEKYYLTVNKLLDIAKNNKSEKYIFLADDSLPSKNFLIHVEKFFQKGAKVVNTAIHQQELRTNWGLNNWVDGGLVITHDIFLKVNQKLEKVVKAGYGTGVFREITLRLNRLNIRVHFPKHSLLYHMGHTDSVMHKEIRKTEQIHSYSFIDDEESPDVFRLETYDLLNQKVQISVSNAVRNFKTKMISKYELKEYINKNQPTVFFGMYDENDYKKFINHVGQKIIVWCGTDALNAKKNKHWWNELKKGVNISMSSFIYKSLEFCGIESTIIPITPTKSTVNVKPKGENIYWYHNSESKKEFYGGKIVEKIKKLTNYKIIEAKVDTFNEEEIQNVYESCFLGLRLTEHDGLPNTVVEMGLMGRYCLHNGNTPNSIQYDPNNVEDIVKKINEEYQSRFKVDSEIAQKVYNYMTSGNDIKKIFFSYDTIVDNKKFEIINKNEILRKKQFPKIGSKQKNKKELSIVIPTYNNVEYLDTCVHSILESSKNFDVEVLIGIDGCQKTLNYIKQKSYPDQIQIYYFDTNNGPYDIKNTLTKKQIQKTYYFLILMTLQKNL